MSRTEVPIHVAYRSKNIERGFYPGQQRFTIKYKDILGKAFDWLHLDFASLTKHCQAAGWNCELMQEEPDGHYLARIVRASNAIKSPS